jgi:hypothetical protein
MANQGAPRELLGQAAAQAFLADFAELSRFGATGRGPGRFTPSRRGRRSQESCITSNGRIL